MSDVTWYKNDVEVKPDDRVTSSLDDLAARLSISNLESADTGVYTCVARCESGVTRCSTELCVFDTKPGTDSYLQPPIFVEGLVPKRTADEGEPVQLTVRLQGAVPMSALWFKNDVLVPNCTDFEYVVTEDRGEFGLSIIDPFVKDSGIYSCKVANSFGQAVSSGKLIINEMSSGNQVPMVIELNNNMQDVGEKTACDSPVNIKAAVPASILSGPYDTTVLRGAKVVLKTSYKGDPEPCVQWLRAGKVLESDAHLCITNERGVSSLTIDSITADDCGKYVVRVDNGHGNDFHFASVAVEGPPDPPAGRPVVSVSETSADVTWSSPAYDGGCMVTGYGVEVRPFNQSDWKLVADKCHSLSHIVRGLAPGESYVFRVRAENMHGSSEASLESTPVYILQTDYGNTLWPKTVNIENGDLFDKQYEMLDELGKGRYGVVYKVKERETNKYYAAKFVRCIKSTDKEKAQEEVDIMNCLRHPKLLQLDAAFDKPREVVLVTEYISGGELFERVVADDFTLTEKDCILFTRQICEGVDYMHKQNVVHLDLKPENIMCQSRTSHYIKLIDFGLAQKIIPGQPMRVLFGTPEFIPPEIIGYEPIGFESDMWSVGVICYVLLSGLSPFMGDNDSETFTNITKAEFDFDDEAFDAVSQDAKDFISALLIKRKELRLTARECLKHKWLAQQDMDMSCVILSTDKLKKFIIRRKWQVPESVCSRRTG
uniref:Myosin light chain kinase, smooth muscle n=1 Tax=Schizaphis graminum TaxID=13262 RepID=A0A2S2P561_SCHGA